ncbi:Dolichol-phosphate mannosyltransferase [Gammaproteobacteria bacterium]
MSQHPSATSPVSKPLTPEVSVVVPVRNEQDNIVSLIDEVHAALEGVMDFEVVYVDDGSDDATPARLAETAIRCPRLRVLRHRHSCGQSTALVTGIRAARGRYVATLDGDGQNDPADILALLAVARADYGPGPLLVAGWRAHRHDTWFRRLSSRVANAVRGRLLKDYTPDTGCGLKVFSRTVFLELPYFDHMHRFLPALFLRVGGRVQSVPVNHRPRTCGTSKYGLSNRLWVGIVDLFGVRWLQARARIAEVEEWNVPTQDGFR